MSLFSEFGLATAHLVTATSGTLDDGRKLSSSDLIFLIASLLTCSVTFTANVVGANVLWQVIARFGCRVTHMAASCFQRKARVHAAQVQEPVQVVPKGAVGFRCAECSRHLALQDNDKPCCNTGHVEAQSLLAGQESLSGAQ